MIQNLQDIEDKIFFESQNILDTLGKISSKEDLLNKQDLIDELSDRVAFLKILNKNKEFLVFDNESEVIDNQISNRHFEESNDFNQESYSTENSSDEDHMEEEVIFTNEINESESHSQENLNLDQDHKTTKRIELNTELNLNSEDSKSAEIFEIDNESTISEDVLISSDEILPSYEERVAQKEKDFLEMEERRRKIVEFSKHETLETPKSEVANEHHSHQSSMEKKFKLASIKGIKAVKNLFDEDPLEKVEEEESEQRETEVGSLLKTNIATEFMEASKKRPDFKMDFNDKIAFTKLLFAGNEAELKKTVDQLNSYEHLEGAKQFLSEVYYKKDWRNVDEYAQRLWTLVENKFL